MIISIFPGFSIFPCDVEFRENIPKNSEEQKLLKSWKKPLSTAMLTITTEALATFLHSAVKFCCDDLSAQKAPRRLNEALENAVFAFPSTAEQSCAVQC